MLFRHFHPVIRLCICRWKQNIHSFVHSTATETEPNELKWNSVEKKYVRNDVMKSMRQSHRRSFSSRFGVRIVYNVQCSGAQRLQNAIDMFPLASVCYCWAVHRTATILHRNYFSFIQIAYPINSMPLHLQCKYWTVSSVAHATQSTGATSCFNCNDNDGEMNAEEEKNRMNSREMTVQPKHLRSIARDFLMQMYCRHVFVRDWTRLRGIKYFTTDLNYKFCKHGELRA